MIAYFQKLAPTVIAIEACADRTIGRGYWLHSGMR
jgi:hypothetical protein